MTKPSPTDEQEMALQATKLADASLSLNAYAGTGKTTTLTMLSETIPGPALALAFNRSIADELRGRFAPSFDVKTMNGLGFGALRRALPGVTKWDIRADKLAKLITSIAKERKLRLSSEDWDATRRTVVAAMQLGICPGNGEARGLSEDNGEAWQDVAIDQGVPTADSEAIAAFAREVLIENNRRVLTGFASFDDQIYWPLVHDVRFPRYPTVLVDEAQDLNNLNHEMVRRVTQSRLVMCGDPRQSIYGFRGAVNESMTRLRGSFASHHWKDLPLTLTWRCPKKIVARQQDHAPGYRAAEGNAEGHFVRWPEEFDGNSADQETYWNSKNLLGLAAEGSLAVLCRNNAPLFKLAFALLAQGIGIKFLGKDIEKALKALSKKLVEDDGASASALVKAAREFAENECAINEANGHEERNEGVHDRIDALCATAEGCRSAGEVRAKLEWLFNRPEGLITLSSIHKSKGLEWDSVLHLDPWRIPSKFAKREGGEALRQEKNLRYVCETRTRRTLIEANLEDLEGAEGMASP